MKKNPNLANKAQLFIRPVKYITNHNACAFRTIILKVLMYRLPSYRVVEVPEQPEAEPRSAEGRKERERPAKTEVATNPVEKGLHVHELAIEDSIAVSF